MKRILGLAAAVAVLGTQATAAVTMLISRSQINADATIDWGQFGVAGTNVPNGSIGSTSGNVFAFKVVGPADMARYDQSTNWSGNFAPGDELIATTPNSGPMTISFARTLNAAGLQLQADFFGAFTASVSAYDGLGDLLGTFSVAGNSTSAADDSAVFLGVRSTGGDIASLVYSTTNDGIGFAVNHASLETCGVVPEPATLSLLGFGVAALVARRRRQS